MTAITDKGYVVKFAQNSAAVKRADGTTALTATKRGQLYIINQKRNRAMRTNVEDDRLIRWHQRLGHLNVNDIRRLKSHEMVGINLSINQETLDCEICNKVKICHKPYKLSTNRSTEKPGLIHSNICRPMKTESLGEAKYFVTFIDDYTRYRETIMLRKKSVVFYAFKKHKRQVEKQNGRSIKQLRTDNAKEYLWNKFTRYLEEEGIKR